MRGQSSFTSGSCPIGRTLSPAGMLPSQGWSRWRRWRPWWRYSDTNARQIDPWISHRWGGMRKPENADQVRSEQDYTAENATEIPEITQHSRYSRLVYLCNLDNPGQTWQSLRILTISGNIGQVCRNWQTFTDICRGSELSRDGNAPSFRGRRRPSRKTGNCQ
jgi:hypothetical protein